MTDTSGTAATTQEGAIRSLASLATVAASTVSAVVLAAQRSGKPVEITQLQATEKAVPALSGVIQRAAGAYGQCEVIDYTPSGSAGDAETMWLGVDAVPLLSSIVTESADLANLPVFEPTKQSLAALRLAAFRVEKDGVVAVFVQSLRSNQIVARSNKLGVFIRNGVLDVPDGEVLILNSDVSAVLVGGYVFFRNRSQFQQLTGLLDELRKEASTTFATVTKQLRIDGLEYMAAAVTGAPAMLGKMASIQRKLDQYPKYREALTMPKLVAFALDHPECGVEITGEGDDATLVFHNDPQRRFKILKLLDDDYLRSELTTLEYEANSKSPPIG